MIGVLSLGLFYGAGGLVAAGIVGSLLLWLASEFLLNHLERRSKLASTARPAPLPADVELRPPLSHILNGAVEVAPRIFLGTLVAVVFVGLIAPVFNFIAEGLPQAWSTERVSFQWLVTLAALPAVIVAFLASWITANGLLTLAWIAILSLFVMSRQIVVLGRRVETLSHQLQQLSDQIRLAAHTEAAARAALATIQRVDSRTPRAPSEPIENRGSTRRSTPTDRRKRATA